MQANSAQVLITTEFALGTSQRALSSRETDDAGVLMGAHEPGNPRRQTFPKTGRFIRTVPLFTELLRKLIAGLQGKSLISICMHVHFVVGIMQRPNRNTSQIGSLENVDEEVLKQTLTLRHRLCVPPGNSNRISVEEKPNTHQKMKKDVSTSVKESLGFEKVSTLEELFIEQLQDLYSAENQLIKALPKMAEAASSPELKKGFVHHLEQTKVHAHRLEEILKRHDGSFEGKTCQAMKGLVKEGSETISEYMTPELKDAALIADAQRVEHYEMAGYGTVVAFAKLLGDLKAEEVLRTTLKEEAATDEKLTKLSDSLNLKPAKKKH